MRRPHYGSTACEIGILILSEFDRRILLPLADSLRSRNKAEIKLLASTQALESPEFVRHCASRGIVPYALRPDDAERGDRRAVGTLDCLVTARQEFRQDHSRTQAFIDIARRLGVMTCEVEWLGQTLTLRAGAKSRIVAEHTSFLAGLAEKESLRDLACRIEALAQAPIRLPGGDGPPRHLN
jgi:hypothetical protein